MVAILPAVYITLGDLAHPPSHVLVFNTSDVYTVTHIHRQLQIEIYRGTQHACTLAHTCMPIHIHMHLMLSCFILMLVLITDFFDFQNNYWLLRLHGMTHVATDGGRLCVLTDMCNDVGKPD